MSGATKPPARARVAVGVLAAAAACGMVGSSCATLVGADFDLDVVGTGGAGAGGAGLSSGGAGGTGGKASTTSSSGGGNGGSGGAACPAEEHSEGLLNADCYTRDLALGAECGAFTAVARCLDPDGQRIRLFDREPDLGVPARADVLVTPLPPSGSGGGEPNPFVEPMAITSLAPGELATAGYFKGVLEFGTKPTSTRSAGFLLKGHLEGQSFAPAWHATVESTGDADVRILAMTRDPATSDLWVGGFVDGPAEIHPSTGAPAAAVPLNEEPAAGDGANAFVARFDESGALQGRLVFEGANGQLVQGIAIEADGSTVAIAGQMEGPMNVGGMTFSGPMPSQRRHGMVGRFPASYAGSTDFPSATEEGWLRSFGTEEDQAEFIDLSGGTSTSGSFFGVALVDGDVVAAGVLTRSVKLAGDETACAELVDGGAPSQLDVVVVRLAAKDGSCKWARRIGGAGTQDARRLHYDAKHGITVGGTSNGGPLETADKTVLHDAPDDQWLAFTVRLDPEVGTILAGSFAAWTIEPGRNSGTVFMPQPNETTKVDRPVVASQTIGTRSMTFFSGEGAVKVGEEVVGKPGNVFTNLFFVTTPLAPQ